jgi:hypothetical protein
MVSAGAPGTNPPPNTLFTGSTIRLNPLTTNPNAVGVHHLLYCPSRKYMVPNNASYLPRRTATRTYVKGISETWTIGPADQSTWWWRRIVFSIKGLVPNADATVMSRIGAEISASSGSSRKLVDLTGESTGDYQKVYDTIQELVFQGVKTTDWSDVMLAKVDKTRINLHYDTRTVISSANDRPRPRVIKRYHAINKTLHYDDQENGLEINPLPYSVESKQGMGDILILDLFQCKAPDQSDATKSGLNLECSSTYYWHEK